MSRIEIRLTESAEAQILEAFDWYSKRSATVADRFIDELDSCLEQISSFPLSHPTSYRELRRALLNKFPFKVFYRIDHDVAYVFAVLHHSRSEEKALGNL